MESIWARHAGWWREHFTEGADAEYTEQIVPLVLARAHGARRVLDLGCGEGQIARRLAGEGAEVLGLDPTEALLEAARGRAGGPAYVRGRAEAIPLAPASVDLVVMTLVLEHLDPIEPVLAEVARVLEPGGRMLVVMNHPLVQTPGSCWVDDADFGDQYWRLGPYLPERVVDEEVAPGVSIPFVYRPLGRYVDALGTAGMAVVDMAEPPPAPSAMRHLGGFRDAATIPRVLALVAIRFPGGAGASLVDQ